VDIEPIAVPLPLARQLLGNKPRSTTYELIADGTLVVLKDGRRTLITLESIRAYMLSLPRGVSKLSAGKALRAHRKAKPSRRAVPRLHSAKKMPGGVSARARHKDLTDGVYATGRKRAQ
jgi:hypothetical protein